MEILKFLKEYNRMCTMYKSCRGCPLEMDRCAGCGDEFSKKQIINIIDKTEQWSKEHPIITNAQKFEEVFGEIEIKDYIKCRVHHMSEDETEIEILESKWWDEPYKEPEHENENEST